MTRDMGMPAARAFTTEGATAGEPVFVINRLHLADWSDAVRRAGVDLEKYVEFEKKEVIGFSADEARTLLNTANLVITKRYASGTPYVEWLWLQNGPTILQEMRALAFGADPLTAAPQIEVRKWNGQGKESFCYLASEILGRVLKRKIVLSVPHGETYSYDPDGNFQIYVWSTPEDGTEKKTRPPEKIWGIATSCRDEAFQPKERKSKKWLEWVGLDQKTKLGILLSDGGYIVAELLPNALYIHHDIVHNGNQNEFRLFAEIMKRAAQYIADPAEWEKYLEVSRKQQELARENALLALVDRSVVKREGRVAATLEVAQAQAERLRSEYFAAERTLFTLQAGAHDPEKARKTFLAEFGKLQSGKVGYIETVKFDPDRPDELRVFTKEITVQNPRTSQYHLLGHFEIIFNLERGEVRILNRDRTVETDKGISHSPHIFYQDGHWVCLGNIEAELQAYIAHFEIEAATTLTVGFLQSVENHSAYIERLEKFPVVEEAAKP